MITFTICLTLLITAYFTYGSYLERVAGADNKNATPALRLADGVDYMKLPRWRVFLIQLLNIAGTGPIFGAILGACFGPVAFIWITLGGIFFGGMHDYLSGMMIVRHDGKSLPEVVGEYLGVRVRTGVRVFTLVVMILVGAVFILSPAQILGNMVPGMEQQTWVWIILAYYVVATMLPIDKVIGKLYPIFGVALIAMAVGLLVVLFSGTYSVPELTTLHNFQLDPAKFPIFPTLFITIACGAISGFHATQSPMMARCVGNEKQCRSVFYGSMITESIIALIWAAVAMAFFGGSTALGEALKAHSGDASWAVDTIANTTLGSVGAILALLGVVAAPITSGDTAFRGARLIVADAFKIDQRTLLKRFYICLPLFAIGFMLTLIDFDVVWRYFGWANQALACVVLWTITVWLSRNGKNVLIALVPALFMTFIETYFVFISPQFVGMTDHALGAALAIALAAALGWWFLALNRRHRKERRKQ